MSPSYFAVSRKACQEGLDWIENRPWIKSLEQGWDEMMKEGNRFIFWMYSRHPERRYKELSAFSLKVKEALGVDDLRKVDDVSKEMVREIMKDYPNPYRGL